MRLEPYLAPLAPCQVNMMELFTKIVNEFHLSVVNSFRKKVVDICKGLNYVSNYPTNIYLFKVNNKNIWKKCEIYSKLLTVFLCFCCELWAHFTPFSGISIVDFEHVNIIWVFIRIFLLLLCKFLSKQSQTVLICILFLFFTPVFRN